MVPIHEYSNWNVRSTDNEEQIEPYRKYIIICEGVNTEASYFIENQLKITCIKGVVD